tara:strand:+ start:183 stop:392 length:210 start_codon:yes stop_codon:yes gene_type:complete
VKVGDLIMDFGDGEIGIVLTEPHSYNSYVKEGVVDFVMVHWPSQRTPLRMDMDAVKNGWVEVVSTGENE